MAIALNGKRFSALFFIAFALCAPPPSKAFDGTPSATQPVELTPVESERLGAKAYRAGNIQEAINRWTRAAEAGQETAQWHLARMFADGKGVPRDDKQAFRWFKQIVEDHADDEPGTPQGRIAGRALSELGSYYMSGIPDSDVKQDMPLAWRMFYQAASIFGDPEAQYQLGRMYLNGNGAEKNAALAAKWLKNAAEKSHMKAQAALGEMLFNSEGVSARRAEGLMWLSVARNQAKTADDEWVITLFEDAYTMASDDERMQAANYVRRFERQATRE